MDDLSLPKTVKPSGSMQWAPEVIMHVPTKKAGCIIVSAVLSMGLLTSAAHGVDGDPPPLPPSDPVPSEAVSPSPVEGMENAQGFAAKAAPVYCVQTTPKGKCVQLTVAKVSFVALSKAKMPKDRIPADWKKKNVTAVRSSGKCQSLSSNVDRLKFAVSLEAKPTSATFDPATKLNQTTIFRTVNPMADPFEDRVSKGGKTSLFGLPAGTYVRTRVDCWHETYGPGGRYTGLVTLRGGWQRVPDL